MNARILLLLALAAGLAVFLAMRSSAPPNLVDESSHAGTDDEDDGKPDLLWVKEGPGETPDVPAEFDIQLEVDTSTGKNRLVYYITETHGFYVNTLYLRTWWHEAGEEIDEQDSPHSFESFVNNYIKAGETLKYCIELTDPEIANAGGDIGTSDNWSVEVERCIHVRAKNRDPLLEVDPTGRHCG